MKRNLSKTIVSMAAGGRNGNRLQTCRKAKEKTFDQNLFPNRKTSFQMKHSGYKADRRKDTILDETMKMQYCSISPRMYCIFCLVLCALWTWLLLLAKNNHKQDNMSNKDQECYIYLNSVSLLSQHQMLLTQKYGFCCNILLVNLILSILKEKRKKRRLF